MICNIEWLFLFGILNICAFCKTLNFQELGGISNKFSEDIAWHNGRLLNMTLAKIVSGTTLIFPQNETFYMMGGIVGENFSNVTIRTDGKITFSNDTVNWPRTSSDHDGKGNSNNIGGILDGNGLQWWGHPGLGYLHYGENRPRLFKIEYGVDIFIENMVFLNSPYWSFYISNVDGLEVTNCEISSRRSDKDDHNMYDMTAFNTDGYDVTGKNVWIHDSSVWCQDDAIAVKDGSENMLFERITASGVGLTIGSIGSSVVKNITFRDCYMPNPYKGIYLKFREDEGGLIEDVLFENIVIDNPSQWPIWIGPAQQSDTKRLCAAHPCSICWPLVENAECNAPLSLYRNIVLKNITVNNATMSPGVLFGNKLTPMENLVFDDVVFNNPGMEPWGEDYYMCDGIKNGVALGNTWPVPPCFKDLTNKP